MRGSVNILFWGCNALPRPFITTALGAVAQYPERLSLAVSHAGASRSAASPEEVAVLKYTNYLFANVASAF